MNSFAPSFNAVVNGASRGIGWALVAELLGDPTVGTVFATARSATTSDALATLGARHGARLQRLDMDVTDERSVAQAAHALGAMTARVDLLINCAGVLHDSGLNPERRLADVDPANLARSFAVNATGPLLVAKHFHAFFPRRERAVLASLSARVGSIGDNRLGGWYAYRASKAAQNMITRNLAIELSRRSRAIVCVALHPGTVDTGLSRPFQARVPAAGLFSAERAARQLLEVIDGLGADDNGGFLAWDAKPIPW